MTDLGEILFILAKNTIPSLRYAMQQTIRAKRRTVFRTFPILRYARPVFTPTESTVVCFAATPRYYSMSVLCSCRHPARILTVHEVRCAACKLVFLFEGVGSRRAVDGSAIHGLCSNERMLIAKQEHGCEMEQCQDSHVDRCHLTQSR